MAYIYGKVNTYAHSYVGASDMHNIPNTEGLTIPRAKLHRGIDVLWTRITAFSHTDGFHYQRSNQPQFRLRVKERTHVWDE